MAQMEKGCSGFQQQGGQKDFGTMQADSGTTVVPAMPMQVPVMNGQPVVNGPGGQPCMMVMMMPQDQRSQPSQISQMAPVCQMGENGTVVAPMMTPQMMQPMSSSQQMSSPPQMQSSQQMPPTQQISSPQPQTQQPQQQQPQQPQQPPHKSPQQQSQQQQQPQLPQQQPQQPMQQMQPMQPQYISEQGQQPQMMQGVPLLNQQPDQMANLSQPMQYFPNMMNGTVPSSVPQSPWIQVMQEQLKSEDSTQYPAEEQAQDRSQQFGNRQQFQQPPQNQWQQPQLSGQQYFQGGQQGNAQFPQLQQPGAQQQQPRQSNHQESPPQQGQMRNQQQQQQQQQQQPRWPGRRGAKASNNVKKAPQYQADLELANSLNDLFNNEGYDLAEQLLGEPGAVLRLSFQPVGCRQVQRALETFSRETVVRMASSLEGSVVQAIQSPHANYVLQKIIKVVPIEEVPWLVQELSERCLELAQHEYGCRVFCRLLENASHSACTNNLVFRLFESVERLIKHQYGHHVVECALEHGETEQQKVIFQVLLADLMDFSRNPSGAHVIEKALHWGPWDERQTLVQALLSLPSEELAMLAKHHAGSIVVRAMRRVSGQVADKASEILRRTSTTLGGPRRAGRGGVRRQA